MPTLIKDAALHYSNSFNVHFMEWDWPVLTYRTFSHPNCLALYNYHYIRPDTGAETRYHQDPGRILSFVAIYTKRRGLNPTRLNRRRAQAAKTPAALREFWRVSALPFPQNSRSVAAS